MSNYTFRDLPIGGLFISAERILREKSCLEFILEKISENKAIYRDDKGKIQRTISIQPDESIIRLCYLSSYPHHGRGPKLPFS